MNKCVLTEVIPECIEYNMAVPDIGTSPLHYAYD